MSQNFDDIERTGDPDWEETFSNGDESGDYVYCPRCGALMETDPDGAYCEPCHDYYMWSDLDSDE